MFLLPVCKESHFLQIPFEYLKPFEKNHENEGNS